MVNKWLTKSIIGGALAGLIIATGPVMAQERGQRGDRDRDRAGQSQQHNGDQGRTVRSHRGDRGHVAQNHGRGHNRHAIGRNHGHGQAHHARAHRHNNHAYHRHDRHGYHYKISKRQVRRGLKRQGFHNIVRIRDRGDRYVARAENHRHRSVRVVVNAYNGRVIRVARR